MSETNHLPRPKGAPIGSWAPIQRGRGRPSHLLQPGDPELTPGFTNPIEGVTMAAPEKMPRERGKGGRPTKGESATGADALIGEVRQKTRQFHDVPPREKWRKELEDKERAVEVKEAEAMLSAREQRLLAVQAENLLLEANRQLALRLAHTGVNTISLLDTLLSEVKRRSTLAKDDSLSLQRMSNKDLTGLVGRLTNVALSGQEAVEKMARAERWMARHPLDTPDDGGDDTDNMSTEDAEKILKNMADQLKSLEGQFKQPYIVGDSKQEPDADP